MIKYPNGTPNKVIKKDKPTTKRHIVNAANRGMSFEECINSANEYYLDKDIAVITKRPTPINVVKVDYSHGAKITHAYFEKQSTTDYNGVYKGKYLDFEAKSTKNKTSIPLSNITKHQITHLSRVLKHGGIAFFIIEFASLREVYVVPASFVINFFTEKKRKSIPLSDIKEHGILVEEKYRPHYDYLVAVDRLFL